MPDLVMELGDVMQIIVSDDDAVTIEAKQTGARRISVDTLDRFGRSMQELARSARARAAVQTILDKEDLGRCCGEGGVLQIGMDRNSVIVAMQDGPAGERIHVHLPREIALEASAAICRGVEALCVSATSDAVPVVN